MRRMGVALCAGLALIAGAAEAAGNKGGLYDFSIFLSRPIPYDTPRAVPTVPSSATGVPTYLQPPAPSFISPATQPAPFQASPQRVAAARSSAVRPVYDRDDGWFGGFFDRLYLQAGAGYDIPSDFDGRAGAAQFSVDVDPSYVAGVAIGTYFAENWRAEMAFDYRQADYGDVRSGGAKLAQSGELTVPTLLFNAFYDTPFDVYGIRPYIGLGLGAAFVDGSSITVAGVKGSGPESTELAYQGAFGVSYRINETWTLGLDYRYLGTGDSDVAHQSGVLSVRFDL